MNEQTSSKKPDKASGKADGSRGRKQALTVYVGPDRPFGLPLRTSAVLRGEPLPQLAAVIEANPDLKKLFVPVEELAETRCQLRKEGSGMQRLFKIINEASRKARKAKE